MKKINDKIHIVILSRWLGFPNGMATTQRVRLLAQGMVENGADVVVLILYPSEQPPHIRNLIPKGMYKGIRFEYVAGTTIRPEGFVNRRWLEIKSIVMTTYRLVQLKLQGRIDSICYWLPISEFVLDGMLIIFLAKLLHIPVVREICERPWSAKEAKSFIERRISPIIGTNGAITISDYLYHWVNNEAKLLSKKFSLINIPIVADANEYLTFNEPLEKTPTMLFAGSPAYGETIRFILSSMSEVWKHYADCRLIITGCEENDPLLTWIKDEIDNNKLKNVVFTGYLERQILLQRYMSSWALLIPLFKDVRSIARFPTKIGEYLLSGRPVITNSVGDVAQYLEDGVSALISEPDNVNAYAEKIMNVIRNPSLASSVGSKGKQVAIESFHYGIYGKKLVDFFTSQA